MEALALVVVAAAFGMVAYAWHFGRGRALLDSWARRNRYEILEAEYRMFLRGPFWWRSNSNAVYRVVVRDEQGRTRRGYVRCGSFWWGMISSGADVEWTG